MALYQLKIMDLVTLEVDTIIVQLSKPQDAWDLDLKAFETIDFARPVLLSVNGLAKAAFSAISSTQHCTSTECPFTLSHTAKWCGYDQPRRCGCPFCYTD